MPVRANGSFNENIFLCRAQLTLNKPKRTLTLSMPLLLVFYEYFQIIHCNKIKGNKNDRKSLDYSCQLIICDLVTANIFIVFIADDFLKAGQGTFLDYKKEVYTFSCKIFKNSCKHSI